MVDFSSPGVKVFEKRQEPFASLADAATFGAMQGKTERGPVNKPTAVTSLDDYREVFGGNISDSFLADSVQHAFQNGMKVLWVNRIAHYTDITSEASLTAVAAETMLQTASSDATSGTLESDGAAFPVALVNGETFIGSVDGGGDLTATVTAARASVTGTGATYAAGAGGDSLEFTIDGSPFLVDLSSVGATQLDYLNAINAAMIGTGTAEDDGGEIKILSDLEGSDSAGEITVLGGAAAVNTGLSLGVLVNAGPNNVANLSAVLASELAAIFDAAFTGSTSVPDDGLGTLSWGTSATGASSSVQFTGGTGVSKVLGFDSNLHSGVDAVVAQDTLNAAASSPGSFGNGERVSVVHGNLVAAKVQTVVPAGSTDVLPVSSIARFLLGDTVSVTLAGDTQRAVIKSIDSGLRQLKFVDPITVPVGGYLGTEDVIQETFSMQHIDQDGLVTVTFSGLRMSQLASRYYAETVINGTNRSPLEVADQELVPSSLLDPRPVATVSTYLGLDTPGSDGDPVDDLDFIGDAAAGTGLRAYDDYRDFILLSQPGETSSAVQLGLESYAELRQDFFAVQEIPQGLGVQDALDHVTNVANLASSYEAIYYPWIQAVDVRTGLSESFPPSGFVQGVIARVHKRRNFGKAPAGIVDGKLNGATGVDVELGNNYDLLYPKNINGIVRFEGAGISVFGSRTLDPIGDFRQINVRFVFLFVKRDFEVRTRFAVFENNDPRTRGRVTRTTTSALRELREAEILQGESDEEAFFVVCDESNNTATVIQNGKLKCRIGMAVQRPSEFVEITLEQDTRAIDAELASN